MLERWKDSARSLHFFVIVAYSHFFINCHSQGIPAFKFLTDTCGDVPDETLGTGRWAVGLFVKKDVEDTGIPVDLENLEFLHTGAIVRSNVVLTLLKVSPDGSSFVDEQENILTKIYVVLNSTDSGSFAKLWLQISEVDVFIPYVNSPAKLGYQLYFPDIIKYPEGQTAKVYRIKRFMYIGPESECEKRFSALYEGDYKNLYCGWRYADTVNGVCGSVGSIDHFKLDGRMYLFGLTVLVPENACSRNNAFFLYNLLYSDAKLQNWMINSLKCLSINKFNCPSGECVDFAKVCNNRPDCMDGSGFDEHPAACRYTNTSCPNSFFCGVGYGCVSKSEVCNGRTDCKNEADESSLANCRVETTASPGLDSYVHSSVTKPSDKSAGHKGRESICPVFQYSAGVAFRCSNNGVDVDCQRTTVDTKIEVYCKDFYISNARFATHEMTCKEDGSWAPYKPFSCKADCGRIQSDPDIRQVPYISSGKLATRDFAFPWHVSIFTWKKDTQTFDYSCGGSLIENSVFVTAAHCLTNRGGKTIDSNDVRIVLTATSSSFQTNWENSASKILGVSRIWIPRSFDPLELTSDIALVQLNETVDYNSGIQPVCYLTETASRVPALGSVGLLAGFGKSDSYTASENLKWASFPVVSNEECAHSLRVTVGANEFCGGFQNGTAACQGDSGGGLVFKQISTTNETSTYVLKGIVSRGLTTTSGKCSVNTVTVFTYIDSFGAWILDTLTSNDIF